MPRTVLDKAARTGLLWSYGFLFWFPTCLPGVLRASVAMWCWGVGPRGVGGVNGKTNTFVWFMKSDYFSLQWFPKHDIFRFMQNIMGFCTLSEDVPLHRNV
jgi:hypothetical protein